MSEKKSPSKLAPADEESASANITKRIQELGDWRGETLAQVRQLIHDADADIQEAWKWVKASSPGTRRPIETWGCEIILDLFYSP